MNLHPAISSAIREVPAIGERTRVYLLPGDLRVSTEPCQMTTILGSCVAVCLWDRKLRIGGMNHFLLPEWRNGNGSSLRFGDVATRVLLQQMLDAGAQRRNLEAKVFGGSALFRSEEHYPASLGAQNVYAALLLLKNAQISVAAQDTGGRQGRKIIFHSDDGTAWARPV